MIVLFFNINFPEKLSDEDWAEKVLQLKFLAEAGLLGMKKNIGI